MLSARLRQSLHLAGALKRFGARLRDQQRLQAHRLLGLEGEDFVGRLLR